MAQRTFGGITNKEPKVDIDDACDWHQLYRLLLQQNEQLRADLKMAICSDSDTCKILEADNERLRAELQTCRNTAKINLKVAQDRGAEIERLRTALPRGIWNAIMRLLGIT